MEKSEVTPIKKKAADLIVDPVSLSSVGYNNQDITHRASSICQAMSQFWKFYIHSLAYQILEIAWSSLHRQKSHNWEDLVYAIVNSRGRLERLICLTLEATSLSLVRGASLPHVKATG